MAYLLLVIPQLYITTQLIVTEYSQQLGKRFLGKKIAIVTNSFKNCLTPLEYMVLTKKKLACYAGSFRGYVNMMP